MQTRNRGCVPYPTRRVVKSNGGKDGQKPDRNRRRPYLLLSLFSLGALRGRWLSAPAEISDKLRVTSAEPQRYTKRGTTFPYTPNTLVLGH